MRLDVYLVKNDYYQSRHQAQIEIKHGSISVNDKIVTKPSVYISDDDRVKIINTYNPFASKGGLKLEAALSHFNVDVQAKHVLDIGSSTGGFTDVLLQHNVSKVTAVDVGNLQMIPPLRHHEKVTLLENTNFLHLDSHAVSHPDLLVMDVSFTSCIPLIKHAKKTFQLPEMIILIKPQFETIKTPKSGIIKDPKLHLEILRNVEEKLITLEYYIHDIMPSPIKGGSGNIEFLVHIKTGLHTTPDLKAVVKAAHQKE